MFRTSWFSQNTPDNSQASGYPARSSDIQDGGERPSTSTNGNGNSAPRSSTENNPRSKQPPVKHTTPHDAIIAQLQSAENSEPTISPTKNEGGGRMPDTAEDGQRSPDTPTLSPAASHSRLGVALSPAPSLYTGITTANVRYAGNQPNGSVQRTTVDVLLDPFDGSSHGVLLPQEISIGSQDDAQTVPRFNSTSVAAASERMWSHLSKVLDLQSQIARMHMDMEGVGPGGDGRKKTKGKHVIGSRSGLGDDRRMYNAVPSLRARAMSTSTIGTIADEKEVDEEGVGVVDEETEKNRAREEEFAKLANQFEGKKDSIRDMMNKLDDLSKALTEFHALQVNDATNMRPGSVPPSPPITVLSPTPAGSRLRPTPKPALPPSSGQLPDNMLWAAPQPLQVAPSGSAESSFLPKSLSRIPPGDLKGRHGGKPTVPTLIVNAETQPQLIESPASTLGSLPSHHADD